MVAEIHHSILHKHLVLGGDRECVLALMVVCLPLLFGVKGFLPRVFIALVMLLGIIGLRQLARADPWYVPIMLRSRNMVGRFAARGHPDEMCGELR